MYKCIFVFAFVLIFNSAFGQLGMSERSFESKVKPRGGGPYKRNACYVNKELYKKNKITNTLYLKSKEDNVRHAFFYKGKLYRVCLAKAKKSSSSRSRSKSKETFDPKMTDEELKAIFKQYTGRSNWEVADLNEDKAITFLPRNGERVYKTADGKKRMVVYRGATSVILYDVEVHKEVNKIIETFPSGK